MQAKFHRMLKISKNDQEIALYILKKDTIIIVKEKQTRKLIGMSENFMRKEKSKSIKIKGI